ncbi:hypothetical protein DH2020_041596 [Rehmannia glutinosa]|uniref:X8 domain-containing protein n=1 Tax=Rehmannia glutinosa TaxID=99300 RepID=A0ABR0URN3_REHGL
MVVDLLLQNGVPEARVYTSQEDILQAFAGSGISLTITIFNISSISSYEDARAWIHKKSPYISTSNVRRVFLGDQAFARGLTDKTFLNSALNALEFIQTALNEAGYGDLVKATLPHPFTILKDNITKPSEAEFKDVIKEEILRLIRFIQANDAPFVIELFPIEIITLLNMDPSFGFPDNKSTHVVTDVNGAVYTNVFEFVYDSFVWALEKSGAPNLKPVVSQVGWPTDAYPGASSANAERFFKSLLPLVASNKGTPKRPGSPIDTYVHCLADENRNPSSAPHARHWGIYRSNGEPKYKIDLTGKGRDIFPATAKGIMRMPERWCVLNEKTITDSEKAKVEFDFACKNADCTSLSPGGSCSQLSYIETSLTRSTCISRPSFRMRKLVNLTGLASNLCVFDFDLLAIVLELNGSLESCTYVLRYLDYLGRHGNER